MSVQVCVYFRECVPAAAASGTQGCQLKATRGPGAQISQPNPPPHPMQHRLGNVAAAAQDGRDSQESEHSIF